MVSYMTAAQIEAALNKSVLILIVVEDGLVQALVENTEFVVEVLILIVVEDGLVHTVGYISKPALKS